MSYPSISFTSCVLFLFVMVFYTKFAHFYFLDVFKLSLFFLLHILLSHTSLNHFFLRVNAKALSYRPETISYLLVIRSKHFLTHLITKSPPLTYFPQFYLFQIYITTICKTKIVSLKFFIRTQSSLIRITIVTNAS